MLKLSSRGLLTPATIIPCPTALLEEFFVKKMPKGTRPDLFNGYKRYCSDLKNACGNVTFYQWVDGSFVTNKVNPGDIDLVSFIDHQTIEQDEESFKPLKYPGSQSYGLDAYIVKTYPERHKLYTHFQSDRSYWLDKFGKTRLNRNGNRYPKGFVEINY